MKTTSANDVSGVKKRLNDFRECERDIDNQIERLERLEARIYSLSSPKFGEVSSHSGGAEDKIAMMVYKRDKQREKVSAMIGFQQLRREALEKDLTMVKNPDERAVIEMRYIDGESWNGVSEMLFGGKNDYEDKRESYLRRTTKLHGRALVSMSRLNEKEG